MPQAISIQRLFLFTIILKVTVSLLGWWMGSLWIMGFIIPLAIMGAYVWIGLYRRDADAVSDEKFADSCYYLGFIFTISSIIVSLLDLPSLNQGGKLGDIAVRFAAAMVSTVIGLVVRVYLVNFRKDLSDITKAMEDDLLEAERTFRTHLGFAVDNLKALNSTVNDVTKDIIARVEISITETAEANSKEITRIFDEVGRRIGITASESSASITSSSAELQKAIQLYVTSLMTSTKHHEDKLNVFSENLNKKIDLFSETFVVSLNGLSQKIDSFSHELNGKLNNVDFPAHIFSGQLNQPVLELRESLGNITGELNKFSGNIGERVVEINTSLSAVPGSVRETTDKIRDAVSEQRKTIDAANTQEQALLKLARNIKHFETALDQSTRGLTAQHEVVERLASTVATVASDNSALRDYAGQQSIALSSMAAQVHRLCETMDLVTGKLQSVPDQNLAVVAAVSSASIGQVGALSAGFSDLSEQMKTSFETLVSRLDGIPAQNREIVAAVSNASIGQVGALSAGFSDLSGQIKSSISELINETQATQKALSRDIATIKVNQLPSQSTPTPSVAVPAAISPETLRA